MAAAGKRFTITQQEAETPLWQKLKAHLETRLQAARVRNDGKLDGERTARLRGRIAEIKYLAALDDPAPQTEADDFPDS